MRATFQALSEYTPEPSEEDGVTSELVKSLPKCVIVQLDGLIPLKCLHGLGLAVRHPSYHLTRFEIDLLPYHTYQVRFPSKVFNFILMISYKNAWKILINIDMIKTIYLQIYAIGTVE